MIANYHTHTRWCRHAVGEIEDYVLKAAEGGLQELAITEHVPLLGDPDPRRMGWDEFQRFNLELESVIDKYAHRITVIKGLECEYIPRMLPYYAAFRKDYGYELLILGQHTSSDRTVDYFATTGAGQIAQYAEEVCAGIETGMFSFLAHPDVFLAGYRRYDEIVAAAMGKIFAACEKADIPVEINANGASNHRFYPCEEVFALSKNYKLTYLINSDAHAPADLFGAGIQSCEALAKRLELPVLQKY